MENRINLIGISGKIGSGKDTIGRIIQYLTAKDIGMSFDKSQLLLNEDISGLINTNYEIKKFAGKLKDVVCLLIGCTRKQLEDIDFKNKELGKEWKVYYWYSYRFKNNKNTNGRISKLYNSKNDAIMGRTNLKYLSSDIEIKSYKLTPRLLLQLLGTEAGRNIIHPNIWVNALFADYEPHQERIGNTENKLEEWSDDIFPNWLITDMRFENELEAVTSRKGITIRVNRRRTILGDNKLLPKDTTEHPSETGLDNATFDYTIKNNGTIEELIVKVKKVLIKEKIL